MAKKKAMNVPISMRRNWINPGKKYSIRRQCRLAGLTRSHRYYDPVPTSKTNLLLMRLIDEQYMKHPEYGSPRMTDWLIEQSYQVNHKRVARLMQQMGLQAITPGPHTSKPAVGHKIYPYLLRGVNIASVGHVWSSDFTYIAMAHGFMYLTAVIDWFSRYVISWELSNTMESSFCVSALQEALAYHGTKVDRYTADAVEKTIVNLMDLLPRRSYTLTVDNGKEFASHESVAEALRIRVYFADPYSAWQRGLNENTNGLIRQYVPKGSEVRTLTDEQVGHIMDRLNNRPRKALDI